MPNKNYFIFIEFKYTVKSIKFKKKIFIKIKCLSLELLNGENKRFADFKHSVYCGLGLRPELSSERLCSPGSSDISYAPTSLKN